MFGTYSRSSEIVFRKIKKNTNNTRLEVYTIVVDTNTYCIRVTRPVRLFNIIFQFLTFRLQSCHYFVVFVREHFDINRIVPPVLWYIYIALMKKSTFSINIFIVNNCKTDGKVINVRCILYYYDERVSNRFQIKTIRYYNYAHYLSNKLLIVKFL